jgi:hypothetical protein
VGADAAPLAKSAAARRAVMPDTIRFIELILVGHVRSVQHRADLIHAERAACASTRGLQRFRRSITPITTTIEVTG